MDMPPMTQAILFTIPPTAVAVYRTWRAETDLAYLHAQLTLQGWMLVVRLGEEKRLRRIETMPALGEAEPHYGDIGGGFHFHFRPSRSGCTLTVEPPASPGVIFVPIPDSFHVPSITPLELSIDPVSLLAQPVDTAPFGGYDVLDEHPNAPTLPWRFGLTGPTLARLLAWGWDATVPAAYTYTFQPTNVGCFVHVSANHGGVIDLTEDVCW